MLHELEHPRRVPLTLLGEDGLREEFAQKEGTVLQLLEALELISSVVSAERFEMCSGGGAAVSGIKSACSCARKLYEWRHMSWVPISAVDVVSMKVRYAFTTSVGARSSSHDSPTKELGTLISVPTLVASSGNPAPSR